MRADSRELRDLIIRGLARAGLAWALAVMAAIFMAQGAQGDTPYRHTSSVVSTHGPRAGAAGSPESDGTAPSRAGLALGVLVLLGGGAVLAFGAWRPKRTVAGDLAADLGDHPVREPQPVHLD